MSIDNENDLKEKVIINDEVVKALADIQEEYESYDRYLDELSGWIIAHNEMGEEKMTVGLLGTVHVIRGLVRQLSGEKA